MTETKHHKHQVDNMPTIACSSYFIDNSVLIGTSNLAVARSGKEKNEIAKKFTPMRYAILLVTWSLAIK
jgi:hypothetical protein